MDDLQPPCQEGPPRLVRSLLGRMLPPGQRELILDDLNSLWQERRAVDGRRSADRWYRRQALSAAWPAIHARFGRALNGRSVAQDLRYSVVQLRRHPGVGALVVLTLALGIGSTASIFSVVRGTLLRPLPYEDPASLVMVTAAVEGSQEIHFLSTPDALGMADDVAAVAEVAVLGETTVGPLTGIDRPQHVKANWMSWNTFSMLGVDVARGRSFVEADGLGSSDPNVPESPGAAILSHGLWVRAFGADPELVGRTIGVWGDDVTVVGVLPQDAAIELPPALNVGSDVDVWLVYRGDLRDWDRDADWFRALARTTPGVSRTALARQVDAYAARLRNDHPRHALEGTRFRLTPLDQAVHDGIRGPILALFAAVVLVLLVASANAANLLLARGTVRSGEMALRAALGAGRGRLTAQLLTESGVLAALATILGVALARIGVDVLHRLRPPDLVSFDTVRLDPVVLLFAVVLGVLTTLAAGTLPALQAGRLADTASSVRGRRGAGMVPRARETLVVLQVALSVMLLGGTALLVRTFGELQAVPLGFDPDRILTATATQTLRPPPERQAYERELVRAALSIPGVERAGIVFPLPMNGVYERTAEYVPDAMAAGSTAWRRIYYRTVSEEYFGAMGLEILQGRGFQPEDELEGQLVVVVDRQLASQAFDGGDPVGRTVRVSGIGWDTVRARVVGVVEWTPQRDHRDARPTAYFPRRAYLSHEVSLVARVRGDAGIVTSALAEGIRAVDRRFPVDVTPMSRYVGDRLARARFVMVLMQTFAAVALALTAIGLYGVLSYTVRQRSREMGVRRALGESRGDLTARVVGSGLALAAAGVGLGTVGALAAGSGLRSQLYGIEPWDPVSAGWTAGTVLVVAALASLIPALRAGCADPMRALREE